ncbi:hypothetical protein J6590_041112 [Homalodisca vitripennis]|nr:hypothetical protein J6590_041112 [Homalodisca vitripennis]
MWSTLYTTDVIPLVLTLGSWSTASNTRSSTSNVLVISGLPSSCIKGANDPRTSWNASILAHHNRTEKRASLGAELGPAHDYLISMFKRQRAPNGKDGFNHILQKHISRGNAPARQDNINWLRQSPPIHGTHYTPKRHVD